MRVLLVEDESLVSMYAEDVLTEAGFDVLLAMRLDEALDRAEAASFDLAVLDVNLGNGDTSYPVARRLRERGVPFVFATGYGSFALPDEFAAETLVQKPYDAVVLAALARERVARR